MPNEKQIEAAVEALFSCGLTFQSSPDRYRAAARAALEAAEGVKPTGWQPIETAPKDGSVILAAHQCAIFTVFWEKDGRETDTGNPAWIDGSMSRYEEFYTYDPTHWQPLPSPPALTTEGDE